MMDDLTRRETEILFIYISLGIKAFAGTTNMREIINMLFQMLGFTTVEIYDLVGLYHMTLLGKNKPSIEEAVYVLDKKGYTGADIAKITGKSLNYMYIIKKEIKRNPPKISFMCSEERPRDYELMASFLIMAGRFSKLFAQARRYEKNLK